MNDQKVQQKLSTYRTKNKKYPGFICQEVMLGFMKKWEVKSFWINGKYSYYIATKACDEVFDEEEIYETCQDDIGTVGPKILSLVKSMGKKVLDCYIKKHGSTPLYLRIDFGCCGGNTLDTSKYFLNEIEYAGCGIFLEAKNTMHHWTKGYYKKALELKPQSLAKKNYKKSNVKRKNSRRLRRSRRSRRSRLSRRSRRS